MLDMSIIMKVMDTHELHHMRSGMSNPFCHLQC